ncbi:hypothetical protein PYJP_08920 [Pyrofollis japonicus]|uniref:class I SAM-dependent methyltransferase n=1 Tax=Pyrofollis japonicus TaxID=3060460 RepID=UPI00295BB531|nr:class I SAM-dependent methyltransferase [Pyrofollis japonicus]BEP17540.1 hypothetical protein PYJP_08920 [Pyrofollis japonicus]
MINNPKGWARKKILRIKYNATSAGYDELYGEEQRKKYNVATKRLRPQGVVLDDGCGTGLFLEYCIKNQFSDSIIYYICLDLSPGMLKKAKERIHKLGIEYLVDIVEADAEYIPLRDKCIDTVFSFTVLGLLSDPTKGLAEIRRVNKGCSIVSILKIGEARKSSVIRFGTYIGETDKDIIFIWCNGSELNNNFADI